MKNDESKTSRPSVVEVYDDRHRVVGFFCEGCNHHASFFSQLKHEDKCEASKSFNDVMPGELP